MSLLKLFSISSIYISVSDAYENEKVYGIVSSFVLQPPDLSHLLSRGKVLQKYKSIIGMHIIVIQYLLKLYWIFLPVFMIDETKNK